MKTKMILTRHPEHKPKPSTNKSPHPAWERGLGSPREGGDGAGLEPEGAQLLMGEEQCLGSPNLPVPFTAASAQHLLEESEVIWKSLRGFYTMQCLSF